MDQVKKLMAGLYKYGFWISCGLIAIGSVAIGVMATMAVQEQAKAQVTRIKSSISSIQPVSAVKDHPNDKTAAARDKVNLDLERDVFELWQKNFKKQRVILTWPDKVGTLFLTEIQDPKYLQPELIPFPEPTTGLLSRTARDNYRNYIVAELPELAPIIKAKWHIDLTSAPAGGIGGPGGMMGPGAGGKSGGPPGGIGGVGGPPGGIGGIGGMGGTGGEGGGPGGGIGGMGTSQVYDPSEVVAWDASSQQLLASKVLRGMERANTPSTLDILYAQEDLWIVKALLNVIAKTNGDALERHRAPIKEIKTLSTGQDAGVKVGGIKMLHAAGSATGSAAPGAPGTGTGGPTAPGTGAGGPVAGKGPAAPGGGDPYGGGAANAVASHPAEMRYVDKKFTYRAHKDIQAAIDSEAFADVDLALAKRIPFRMTLVMDQRELNKLLVNCGNNELMVEVAQVRYNPQAVSTGSSMGGMPGMGGPGAPGAGGMPGAPGAGGMGKGGPGAGSGGAGIGGEDGGGGMGGGGGNSGSSVQIAGPVGLSPYDILVDIYGYVQLYNVPATKKFKLLEKANAEAGATPGANAVPAPGVNPTPVNPVTPPAEAAAAPAAPAEAGGATQGDPATPASGAPATPGETPPATQGGTPPANASPPPGATPPAGQTPPAGTEPSGTPPAGTTPGASP